MLTHVSHSVFKVPLNAGAQKRVECSVSTSEKTNIILLCKYNPANRTGGWCVHVGVTLSC